MAYRYICKQCGSVWYSASSLDTLYKKNCEKCGGELIEFTTTPKLGEILVALGVLNTARLQISLNLQKSLKKKIQIGKILLRLGFVGREDLLKALEIQRKLSFQS
ncbi:MULTISPECIES: hypothetical protein [Thermotoga]|nr:MULTISPECIES: hypothetical protein [Thermotoga]AJG40134.1 hypothetical protein TRQ7_01425 [Thermotoga sp. RQ7]KFZ20901.1 hypothetical protein LA10_10299 [Thermotoga neapolitana LA10]HBF11135.1 hypothetical protein [Thermotoga neapolitana]